MPLSFIKIYNQPALVADCVLQSSGWDLKSSVFTTIHLPIDKNPIIPHL